MLLMQVKSLSASVKAEVAALLNALQDEVVGYLDPVFLNKSYQSRWLIDELNKHDILLFKHGNKVTGILIYKSYYAPGKYKEVSIDFVYTDKDFRGLGIQRQLFKQLMQKYPKDEWLHTLSVDVKNTSAIKFYESLGFKGNTMHMSC